MKTLDFFNKYPDENSCKLAFKAHREEYGVICKKCKPTNHYQLKTKELYKCKSYGFRMSLQEKESYLKEVKGHKERLKF